MAESTVKKPLIPAMLAGKCPRCRTGTIFYSNPYDPSKMTSFNKNCPHCHLNIEREPGFLYGAMYVSYALNVALMVTFGIGTYILFKDIPFGYLLAAIFGPVILFFPLTYRYSRILYMYSFGGFSYNEEFVDNPPDHDVL